MRFRIETIFELEGRVHLVCTQASDEPAGGAHRPLVGVTLDGAAVDPWQPADSPRCNGFTLRDTADRKRFQVGSFCELEGGPEVLSTQGGYDSWAQLYDDEDNPLVALEEQVLGRWLEQRIANSLQVADIGCGTGRRSLSMAARGAQVTAVDFSGGMLAKARKKPGAEKIRFVVCDITQPLPFATGLFDAATCFLVLDHIQRPAELFEELGRIVKPDGFVLITAMHPAMMLRGIQAQFTDPDSGAKVRPASAPNQIADYVTAAVRSGLHIARITEHNVDQALLQTSPRAERFLDWPLLLVLVLTHSPDTGGRFL